MHIPTLGTMKASILAISYIYQKLILYKADIIGFLISFYLSPLPNNLQAHQTILIPDVGRSRGAINVLERLGKTVCAQSWCTLVYGRLP